MTEDQKNRIENFCDQTSLFNRSGWFEYGDHQQVYIRRSLLIFNDSPVQIMDISNLTDSSKNKKSKGNFTKLVEFLESKYNVRISNILNERLEKFAAKRNYIKEKNQELPCFYKLKV